ncbi:unnamed protein product [Schistocephalus solidus]|uniref:PDZ domain-containing protein n=1 Tax=Schistocephalus solidus TaxID=70667 RepID=A0A183T5J8_SCHSO|nr:unnamed protein product [Schistocephalus solidus]
MFVKTETTDNEKHCVRERVTCSLMAHRPTQCVSKSESKAMKELRTVKQIIIKPSDKRRPTVVRNREDCTERAKARLDDEDICRPAQDTQAKAVANRLNKLHGEFKRHNEITDDERCQMKPTDTALAPSYRLPKIHKPNVPRRSIVALNGSLTYNLTMDVLETKMPPKQFDCLSPLCLQISGRPPRSADSIGRTDCIFLRDVIILINSAEFRTGCLAQET